MSSISSGFARPGGSSYPTPTERGVRTPEQVATDFIKRMIEVGPNHFSFKEGDIILGFSDATYKIAFTAIREDRP